MQHVTLRFCTVRYIPVICENGTAVGDVIFCYEQEMLVRNNTKRNATLCYATTSYDILRNDINQYFVGMDFFFDSTLSSSRN